MSSRARRDSSTGLARATSLRMSSRSRSRALFARWAPPRAGAAFPVKEGFRVSRDIVGISEPIIRDGATAPMHEAVLRHDHGSILVSEADDELEGRDPLRAPPSFRIHGQEVE